MRKIRNPFAEREDYNCFACCSANAHGLQMEFYEDGEEVVCFWEPKPHFEGYTRVLHGGIQSTMMDELASWCVFVKMGTAGATSRIDVSFKRPVYTDRGRLTLRAAISRTEDNIAAVLVRLFDFAEILCSEGTVYYFTYPERIARKRLRYPGLESFFEQR